MLVTVPERKKMEAARRRLAATVVVDQLRSYAHATGGRFVVFGSFVSGRMRYDSDLDILIDFPSAGLPEAWSFVEAVCASADIEPDIHDAAASMPDFVKRATSDGLVLA